MWKLHDPGDLLAVSVYVPGRSTAEAVFPAGIFKSGLRYQQLPWGIAYLPSDGRTGTASCSQ